MLEWLPRLITKWRRTRIKAYMILSIILFTALIIANLFFLSRFF
ncbi:MAG: hypothetical protein ACE5FZ_07235 [Nitrospiria bacterium]